MGFLGAYRHQQSIQGHDNDCMINVFHIFENEAAMKKVMEELNSVLVSPTI
jgi:hypothetical protein